MRHFQAIVWFISTLLRHDRQGAVDAHRRQKKRKRDHPAKRLFWSQWAGQYADPLKETATRRPG